MELLNKYIYLKNTLPLGKLFPKSSTEGVWLSSEVAKQANLFENHIPFVERVSKSSRGGGEISNR